MNAAAFAFVPRPCLLLGRPRGRAGQSLRIEVPGRPDSLARARRAAIDAAEAQGWRLTGARARLDEQRDCWVVVGVLKPRRPAKSAS